MSDLAAATAHLNGHSICLCKSGAWFTYETERLGQGREAAKAFLASNPDLREEIDHKVRVACGLDFGDEPVGVPVALSDTAEAK